MSFKHLTLILFSVYASSSFAISEKWQKLFKDFVETNTSSHNLQGLEKARDLLIPEFEALGFKTETRETKEGHKVIVFSFSHSTPKALLIGHIDTVFEEASAFKQFSVDQKFFKGPGVNDMKGGIILMLMALNDLKNKNAKLLESIVIALNDDEEIGSPFSAPILKSIAKDIPYGLIYEPTLASESHVTTTHAGGAWLDITVKGKASHAGAAHNKGINACVELAHKIVEITKLTNYKKKLTMNPGSIKGGNKTNVVCEEASVQLDIRYVDIKDYEDAKKRITQIANKSYVYNSLLKQGSTSTIKEIVFIPSLPASATQALFTKGEIVAKRLGFKLQKEHMGGASDANQLAPIGIQLLSGLGPYGIGAHSEKEVADFTSFEKRKNFSVELLQDILK